MHVPSDGNRARPSTGNFLLAAVRTIVEYVALVVGGTAALVTLARGAGLLPAYATHPGFGGAILAGLEIFTQQLAHPRILDVIGALSPVLCWIAVAIFLFVCARLTTPLPGTLIARLLLAAISGPISAYVVAFRSPVIVGDLASLTVTALSAGVLGAVFGLILLPRIRLESLAASPMHRGHWVVVAVWILFFGFSWVREEGMFLQITAVKDPRLDLVFARWVPGEGAVREEPLGPGVTRRYLTDQELEELRTAGFTGIVHGWGSGGGGGNPAQPKVRFVIIMSRPIQETVDLPKPASGDMLYIQTQQGWERFPRSAPTVGRTVRLMAFAPDAAWSLPTTRLHVDFGLGHGDPVPYLELFDWKPEDSEAPLPTLPENGRAPQ